MPYKDYDPAADNSNWTPWDGEYSGYVNGETEYDLCTEETSSCSSYMYFPGYEIEDNGEINYTEAKYDLSDIRYSFSPSDATIYSNIKYLVNVYTSIIDLGNDIDAWERKGKLIKSHFYEPRSTPTRWELVLKSDNVDIDSLSEDLKNRLQYPGNEVWQEDHTVYKNENGVIKKYQDTEFDNDYYHEENDPSVNPFSFNKAMDDLYNSEETGFMYYTCIIHFADNNSVISDVRSIYCK